MQAYDELLVLIPFIRGPLELTLTRSNPIKFVTLQVQKSLSTLKTNRIFYVNPPRGNLNHIIDKTRSIKIIEVYSLIDSLIYLDLVQ